MTAKRLKLVKKEERGKKEREKERKRKERKRKERTKQTKRKDERKKEHEERIINTQESCFVSVHFRVLRW